MRWTVGLSLLGLLPIQVWAAGSAQPGDICLSAPVAVSLPFLVIVDLNSDGVLDQAQAGHPGEIEVDVSDAAGGYSRSILETGRSVRGLEHADLDGDGDIDLAVAVHDPNIRDPRSRPRNPEFGGSVMVLENDGAGRFARSPSVAAGSGAEELAIGDIDGDGDLDVVAQTERTIEVFRNDGQGLLEPAGIAVTGPDTSSGFLYSVAVGDVDGDAGIDIVASGRGTLLSANDGTGRFGEATRLPIAGQYVPHVLVADLDGDSRADVVTASSLVSVLLGTDQSPARPDTYELLETNPRWMASVDVNHDGATDVLVASVSYDEDHAGPTVQALQVLVNRGEGTFETRRLTAIPFPPDTQRPECR